MELDTKYLYLPKRFWKKHDYCIFLINQIEEFVIDKTYDGLRFKSIRLKEDEKIIKDEHIFDFMLRTGRIKERNDLIRNQLVNALLIDICYFVQEALDCSRKKRTIVTFALLRKPFVYDLIVFLRIMFEEGFIEKFNTLDQFDVVGINEKEKKALIKESIRFIIPKSITDDDIYNLIFNPTDQDSLVNLSTKALHLSTTRNKSNRTEIQNLNFVFSNPKSIISQWEYIYKTLPLLLLYYIQVIDNLVFSILDLPAENLVSRLEARNKGLK